MVEWDLGAKHLSIKDQADLLSVNRTSLYRKDTGPSEDEVQIKHLIDRIHTERPSRGSRGIRDDINNMKRGFRVNRKRIQRYMREMGIQAFYPGPNLSKRNKAHYVYPYLLRNVKPLYPNHIWGIDITYLPMQGRWMYLVVIVDWYSRMVVGYELSPIMTKEFVLKAVNDTITRYGSPTIMNSDQGSQFTCFDYINLLKENSILISMDGKGRALDNAITERFWRTLKWEDIYLMQYDTPKALRIGVHQYIRYYNENRSHSSLEGATPSSVYYSYDSTPQKVA